MQLGGNRRWVPLVQNIEFILKDNCAFFSSEVIKQTLFFYIPFSKKQYIPCFPWSEVFIELFWKNSSYVSGVSLCIFVDLYLCSFVSLYVRMFVAKANKVEGTMSWCLGTYEILAST